MENPCYIPITLTFSDQDKTRAKLYKKIRVNLLQRSQDTQCLYAAVKDGPK